MGWKTFEGGNAQDLPHWRTFSYPSWFSSNDSHRARKSYEQQSVVGAQTSPTVQKVRRSWSPGGL